MKRAKITFFMIAYNEEKYVARAIQSIMDQTESNVELYVRNNGSLDETGTIIQEIAARDDRIHFSENPVNWRKDSKGEQPFINEQGAIDIWPIDRQTLGDYVSFLDADDVLAPTFAEEMLRAAQESQAEITVCGNVFRANGETIIGERLTPDVQFERAKEWTAVLQNTDTFSKLYNVFRTYWGKLFQRDFFLRHYDRAWKSIGGEFGTWLDTVVMLRYLEQCERLTCVRKSLYLFTTGQGSSYIHYPTTDCLHRVLQVEALFEAGMAFLRKREVLTDGNIQFIYSLNWAFCYESMQGLLYAEQIKPEDLNRVIILLNNKIASAYLNQSMNRVWTDIEPILKRALEKNAQNDRRFELYLRYPMRLLYLMELLKAQPDNVLAPVILLGILCDQENQNLLGENLLEIIARTNTNLGRTVQWRLRKEWTERHCDLHNWWLEEIQQMDNADSAVGKLAQQLREAFLREDYEQTSELLPQLSAKSPFHRDALYCRIFLTELIGEHELAAVLAGTARVLFGLDVEMQQLCWMVFSNRG